MSKQSVARWPRPNKRACACHEPLPSLPRGLLAHEVAFGVKYVDWPNSIESTPLTAADLDPVALARLLARAETRAWRLDAVGRHAHRDAYDLAAELKLVIPAVDAARVRGWLAWIHQEIEAVERALEGLAKLRDFIQGHEPEADAWARRQLVGLEQTVRLSERPDDEGISPSRRNAQWEGDDDGDDEDLAEVQA